MLRITVSTSAAAAQRYYTTGLARQDYYSEGQEITGAFHGKAAKRLKLPREVTAEAFAALSENRDPATGETLTARQKENRQKWVRLHLLCPQGSFAALRDDGG